ncbi:MAG: hypothetical protein FJX92_05390 [Bacteroidetes bacterium]|nr:hypothetical protein [Bacteroidota bacterium]
MHFFLAICFLLFFSACQKTTWSPSARQPELFSVEHINARVYSACKQNGKMEWATTDPLFLWSAIVHSDSLVAVGYQPRYFQPDSGWLGKIDLQAGEWRHAREQVIREALLSGAKELEIWQEKFLPVILLRVSSLGAVRRLLSSPYVRYVEPLSYDRKLVAGIPQVESSSGCGNNTPN